MVLTLFVTLAGPAVPGESSGTVSSPRGLSPALPGHFLGPPGACDGVSVPGPPPAPGRHSRPGSPLLARLLSHGLAVSSRPCLLGVDLRSRGSICLVTRGQCGFQRLRVPPGLWVTVAELKTCDLLVSSPAFFSLMLVHALVFPFRVIQFW
ncbi:hypothetical protein H920_17200 [Fukomys damarensis]|uniref:Uncharacterized protein n=1 Tax=Fukomys damarensis TaxID=885580 RepID=A0A091DF25_FUKDA|nr:hypothetical protein H920_17200 [Fukomys damarensis]